MTQDEIIAMLRASCDKDRVDPEQNGFWVIVTDELVAFANLVAQHERKRMAWTQDHWTEYEHNIASAEREACAQLAQDNSDWYGDVATIADLIRARGQA
jgi:hypothetical protein